MSRSSARTSGRAAGGRTRSLVARKQPMNIRVETAPQNTMVSCQPRAASPWPSHGTSFLVNQTTTRPAVKAPAKRNDDKLVRSRESAVMTPMRAEYGMLIAVNASIMNV